MKVDATFLICDHPAPSSNPDRIQFTKFQTHSYVAGPGRRCVLWVSGCHRRCPGCFQSHFFSFQAGESSTIDELAERIIAVEGIEGLTISGGEPFEQSEALSKLCEQVHKQSNLSILAYTGYTVEALQMRGRNDQALLQNLDWLIDGEYRHSLSGPYLWRGSANQRLIRLDTEVSPIFLTPTSSGEAESVQIVLENNQIVVGGFPSSSMEDEFRESLASRGIVLSRAQK